MKEKLLKYINKNWKKDPHYLVKISKEIDINYYTLYRFVTGSRGGNADTFEKCWKWYEKVVVK